jgi:hypothetical protein
MCFQMVSALQLISYRTACVRELMRKNRRRALGTGDEVAEIFQDQEGEEGEEDEEKESELKTHREKRQRIAAAS